MIRERFSGHNELEPPEMTDEDARQMWEERWRQVAARYFNLEWELPPTWISLYGHVGEPDESQLESLEEWKARNEAQTREARLEEIERRRDTVLAEANPNLPTYEAKG